MQRTVRKEPTYPKIDLTKPVDKTKLKEQDCFGSLWSLSAAECPFCHDNELCSILTNDKVNQKAKEVEAAGKPFLDNTDFNINENVLVKMIKNTNTKGQMTVQGLIALVKGFSKCSDDTTVVEWIKRFIKEKKLIYTKDGNVYVK